MKDPWDDSTKPIWATKSTVPYDRAKLTQELRKRGVTLREAAVAASVGDTYFYSGSYRRERINVRLALRLQVLYGIDPLLYVQGEERAFFENGATGDLPKTPRRPKMIRTSKKKDKRQRKVFKEELRTNAQIRSGNAYRDKCKRCMYRGSGPEGCAYLLIVGHSRGCLADACTRYKPGPQIKQSREPISVHVS